MIKIRIRKSLKGLILIMALFVYLPSFAAPTKVSGRVQDTNGELLIGVTITEKGTDNRAVTDVNGYYTITCTTDAPTLVAQYVGFEVLEQKVTGTVLDFILHEQVSSVDEVVVTGYTTQKKISVLGAQSTLKMEHIKAPVGNLSSVLAGRVPGIVSVQRTGIPGQDDSDIWIRGISTMTNRNEGPLVLVDGIERDFNNLDPEDIESVTVLKDAASTAVYGVRGGNGVIIITTKPGVVSKPQFSVDVYSGITQLTKLPELADGITYMEAANEAYRNTRGTSFYSDAYILRTKVANGLPTPEISADERAALLADRTVNKYLYPNVDWFDELYKNMGWNTRANVNIRGGAPNASYYVSLSYYKEKGLTKTDPLQDYSTEIDYDRYNFLTNVNLRPTKMTTIDVGVSGWISSGNYPAQDFSTIYTKAMTTNPVIFPKVYPNGANPGYSPDNRDMDSPWVTLTRRGYDTQHETQINTNLKITQDLGYFNWSKGLKARALIAFDVKSTQSIQYTVDESTWKPTAVLDPTTGIWLDDANLYDADGNLLLTEQFKGNSSMSVKSDKWVYRTFYFEAALDYRRTFAKKHNVSGLVLFNLRNYTDANNGSLFDTLPYKQQSLSMRATYDYDNRYFIEGNLGYTGSENFEPGKRFGWFPAYAIGWVPSNEKFWKPLSKYISFLKIRYSDGTVGNDSSGSRFAYFTQIGEVDREYTTYWWSGKVLAYSNYGYEAQWSKVRKQDLGIDINFLNDDLSFTFELFKERRTNIFVTRNNVPLLAGFAQSISANMGIVENKGYEIQFQYNHQFGKDWFVSLHGNMTWNKDKIIENAQATPAYPWLDQRGHNVLSSLGYIAEGLYTSEEQIKERNITQFGETYPGELVKPGDIMYKDLNGDGHIDSYDQCYISRGDVPAYYYGFGGDIRWKNFGLGFLFQGVADAERQLQGNGIRPFTNSSGGGTLFANITDRWSADDPTNTDVFYPRLAWGSADPSNINNFQTSTWWLRDVSFLRLKNITISYYFPKSWTRNGIIKGGRIYLQGQNVLTFSDFDLWDPELNTDNGTSYPNVRTFSIGVNFNF